MRQGFEEFKTAILNRRRLRVRSIGKFLPDGEWSPRFLCIASKQIYLPSFSLWNA
ncbi:unnamed protein product [Debaryomyces fabryi]|nr:unnamed protein product [Debaryomyces fabryi]